MHPYIPYLLSDITDAYRPEIPEGAALPAMTFEGEMEEKEKWVEGEDHEHTFGFYCGLEAFNFPPPEQLTDDELKTVIEAFRHMMTSWNLDISMPESLPLPLAYTLAIDTLNTKTSIPNSGFITFEA